MHEFYGGWLGLEMRKRVVDRHIFYVCGESMLIVFNPLKTRIIGSDPTLPVPTHGSTGQGHVCFALATSELDGMARRLADAGFLIEADFLWPHGARSIYTRDPAGNSVEFADRGLWFRDDLT